MNINEGNTPSPEPHTDGTSEIFEAMWKNHRDELLARVAELEAALRPFAREADEYKGWIGSVMVEADEEGGTREAWYNISDIRHARDILSPAHHTPRTEGERNAIIEGCALLIDKHVIQDISDGKRLVPRQDGNQDGMRYADGIRSMKWEIDTPPETNVTALREALEWYGKQARLARLIHSEGDKGRHALADDGGKRAHAVLAANPSPETREEA